MKFLTVNRNQLDLLPLTIDELVPAGHLARFIVDILERIDISDIMATYGRHGEKAYHPRMMLALLFYAYANRMFSSRQIAQATYENLPVRFICAGLHPDFTTIAAFRNRVEPFMADIFNRVLLVALELGVSSVGVFALDGTKIQANASKHKALSYKYSKTLKEQIQKEIEELLQLAKDVESNEKRPALEIPDELAKREKRLERINWAIDEIEKREKCKKEAKDKSKNKQKDDDDDHTQKPGQNESKKDSGTDSANDSNRNGNDEVNPKAQCNLTDPDSRIMLGKRGAFEQAFNIQAVTDVINRLVYCVFVTQAANDVNQVIPAVKKLESAEEMLNSNQQYLPEKKTLLADGGYASAQNTAYLQSKSITPLIATKRIKHNTWLENQFGKDTQEEKDAKKLYAVRKSTIEPIFGIIKNIMGFRQFMLRGLNKVQNEIQIVFTSYNLKRLYSLRVL